MYKIVFPIPVKSRASEKAERRWFRLQYSWWEGSAYYGRYDLFSDCTKLLRLGDNGIFISKVRENGAAAELARLAKKGDRPYLKRGDKLLEIDGHSLVNIDHHVST